MLFRSLLPTHALSFGFRCVAFKPGLGRRESLSRNMKDYPGQWLWQNNIERARMLLCLAWLVRVEDTPEHREWLNRVCMGITWRAVKGQRGQRPGCIGAQCPSLACRFRTGIHTDRIEQLRDLASQADFVQVRLTFAVSAGLHLGKRGGHLDRKSVV